jgi:tRNA/tmRNA/rRNA uracil-C5-methylase (TrmA/RlmC/RlmD family)
VGAVHLNRPLRSKSADSARLRSIAPTFERERVTLIVDPPATGLTESVRKEIVDLAPATLIYVSCNPPTVARDLADLRQRFTIESVTPLDMFPQTAEIEVAVSLQAK